MSDYLHELVEPTVAVYGYAVLAEPGLAYTVGLTLAGGSELVVTGKSPPDAHDLIEAVVIGEERPRPGGRCDLVRGPALASFPVDAEHAPVAVLLYGACVRALQVVWADSLGRWPWETRDGPQVLLTHSLAA